MAVTTALPTLYQHYTAGGIQSGLSAEQPYFTLNEKNVTIYSGAMHYFRVPREYWRDRLRRMRAAGLNTVETYVPWNLHEPQDGVFDFGAGGSDWQDFLNVTEFLKIAQEEDLFTIVRPGPYICSEWEFGGFPSWLLRHKGIKLRTSQQTYMQFVARYFNMLLPILAAMQFTRGGPVIAFQVENEYGSTEANNFVPDKVYLEQLRELFMRNRITELLVTSDSPTLHGSAGTLPQYFLQTANFAGNPEKEFNALRRLQKDKPMMAMEFWTGWFDHWGEVHHKRNNSDFYDTLERILRYPASVNMYMFHGGTSYGFLNGANLADGRIDNKGYQPDTTSYDYDAPISENGDYTEKYVMVKELVNTFTPIRFKTPQTPAVHIRVAYREITQLQQLTLSEIITQSELSFQRVSLIPMEFLPINNNSGQSYGYINYKRTNLDIPANSTLRIEGRVRDTIMVLINGVLKSPPLRATKDFDHFGYWRLKNPELNLGKMDYKNATLELLVENWGRVGFGRLDQFSQFKGLHQTVSLNNKQLTDFEIIPLEFKKSFTRRLHSFHAIQSRMPQPALYRAVLNIEDDTAPRDTYLDMSEWTKGVVIVNNFVLGRYATVGPQQSLYLPAPFLKNGENEILVFEHFYSASAVKFSAHPIYKTK